ncbi:MAG: TetR/AcrR family transcriptional regulator, partial [Syntrophomonadaceae bacterium]|nr:TetR/AcrR family transcriptional regulator [Syntrophomonadaceae bacterium]
LELFSRQGYLQTPVRDIIDCSGFGTSTFYRFFANKEAVLAALLQDFLDSIMEAVRRYYTVEPRLDVRFIETKRVVMERFAANPELSALYARSHGLSPGIDRCLKEFDDAFLEFSYRNLRHGVLQGEFRDLPLLPIAHGILGSIKLAVSRWIIHGEFTAEEMVETVVSFHRSLAVGLLAERGAPAIET